MDANLATRGREEHFDKLLIRGILGLFLLGLIVKKAEIATASTAVAVGVLIIFWMSAPCLPENLRPALHSNLTIVLGTLTIFFVGLLISRFVPSER